jgi:hypothetical protein
VRDVSTWLLLKRTRFSGLVPPIVVGVLLPLGLLLSAAHVPADIRGLFLDVSVRFVGPVFAAWWPTLVHRERIEGEGRELLYFLKPRGEAYTLLRLAVLYAATLAPLLMVGLTVPEFTVQMAALLVARSWLVMTFCFCLAFVLGSSGLSVMAAIGFNAVGMPFIEQGVEHPALLVPLYGLAGILLMALGEFTSRRFRG